MPIPEISQALLELLEQRYPDRCPILNDTDREVWFKAGAADVVAHLRALATAQQENILDPTP